MRLPAGGARACEIAQLRAIHRRVSTGGAEAQRIARLLVSVRVEARVGTATAIDALEDVPLVGAGVHVARELLRGILGGVADAIDAVEDSVRDVLRGLEGDDPFHDRPLRWKRFAELSPLVEKARMHVVADLADAGDRWIDVATREGGKSSCRLSPRSAPSRTARAGAGHRS